MIQTPIAVYGAGSWGTALAVLLARNGRPTRLWGRNPAHVAAMRAERRNARFLPDTPFPDGLELFDDFAEALGEARDVLVAVPSEGFRSTLRQLQPLLPPVGRIAWATKGLEPGSGLLLHEVVREVLGGEVPAAVISGPSFASEVARDLPTAVTVASPDGRFAEELAASLHHGSFRAYTHTDLVGVELGGSVKNVLAIAAGISDGLGFGANARAALITRGLAEMMRLGLAMGGRSETFMGLAGLGDLVLTCTDDQSRNRRMGLLLASGKSLQGALEEIGQVVEGVVTAREVARRAARYGVEMPIVEQVRRVVDEGLAPLDAVRNLLARDQKPEHA
ncbi:NAD(P)H-dependent glycerol-3-phosphate dehydrogenase [Endothiovibrio diazotrophicus]